MRYLKAALAGVIGGVLLAIGVTIMDGVVTAMRLRAAMNCVDFVCFGAAQFGSAREVLTAFVIGFVAVFVAMVRHPRRPVV